MNSRYLKIFMISVCASAVLPGCTRTGGFMATTVFEGLAIGAAGAGVMLGAQAIFNPCTDELPSGYSYINFDGKKLEDIYDNTAERTVLIVGCGIDAKNALVVARSLLPKAREYVRNGIKSKVLEETEETQGGGPILGVFIPKTGATIKLKY